jgi:cell division protein FtsQ
MSALGLLGRLQARRYEGRHRVLSRRRPLAKRGRLRRPRLRTVLVLVAALLLAGGAYLWLRDSSLVAVKQVSIRGASGPDAGQIREALRAAARNMTTLDVQIGQLRSAVSPYPIVKGLRVSTHFPHGMTIRVIEEEPVGAVVVDGHAIAVAGDGTLLHDVASAGSLPQIPLRVTPGGRRLTDPGAMGAVRLLAAAPDQLLARTATVTTVASHGLVAQLRNGPSVYFGDADRLAAKWAAVSAVLADPGSAGALYVDVTDPDRPAAGSGTSPDSGSASGTATSSDSGSATGSSSGGGATDPSAAAGGASTTPAGG